MMLSQEQASSIVPLGLSGLRVWRSEAGCVLQSDSERSSDGLHVRLSLASHAARQHALANGNMQESFQQKRPPSSEGTLSRGVTY